jgi:hypothetical protein
MRLSQAQVSVEFDMQVNEHLAAGHAGFEVVEPSHPRPVAREGSDALYQAARRLTQEGIPNAPKV